MGQKSIGHFDWPVGEKVIIPSYAESIRESERINPFKKGSLPFSFSLIDSAQQWAPFFDLCLTFPLTCDPLQACSLQYHSYCAVSQIEQKVHHQTVIL
jgi:hypothetical protein